MKQDPALLQRLYDLLPEGRDNAVTQHALAKRLGLGHNGDRQVRALIEQLEMTGYLVGADDRGCFKPTSMDEIKPSIRRIASQGAVMTRRARTMQAIADRIFGRQQQLL